jgi:hypothetical protein
LWRCQWLSGVDELIAFDERSVSKMRFTRLLRV